MSKENVVAVRYAQALLSSLSNETQYDFAYTELKDLTSTFENSEDFVRVVESPLFKKKYKMDVLKAILAKAQYSKEISNLALLLLREERFSLIALITKSYKIVLNEKLSRALAKVEVAQELSSSDKTELEGKLKTLSGKTLEVTYVINSELLGGFVAQIDHDIWDYSIKGQLEDMGNKILNMRIG
ncbi:MAG: ATP synthase F1 subunit delta [Candidatus Cloacimonadota bacterium]|nr:MAG: ATP synthase F1 subunit delta [Candidatus Cloacimonadota bacterium]